MAGSAGENLGAYQKAIDRALGELDAADVVARVWAIDYRVWSPDPTEIANRLGWLQSPVNMRSAVPELRAFVDEARQAGCRRAVLMGMGGSSLAPDLYRQTFGPVRGYPILSVLDSTDPGAVLGLADDLEMAETLFIVSSKSGTTVEPLSLMTFFHNRLMRTFGAATAGEHFVAITDPGSLLARQAKELGFRRCFLNDPNIGGRYSALSYFGLVAAALVGMDLEKLLDRAGDMARRCRRPCAAGPSSNPGFWLGVVMGELAKAGRDKVTVLTSPPLAAFGAWLEQLIAESTGKNGTGILPVEGELPVKPAAYGGDRLFAYLRLRGDSTHDASVRALVEAGQPVVRLDLRDPYDLGAEFVRWEIATAVASQRLGIKPFDQPNVESAKKAARAAVEGYKATRRLPALVADVEDEGVTVYWGRRAASVAEALSAFLKQARQGDYVALQAYLPPCEETTAALQGLRIAIRDRLKTATTLGYGPRFLHSTGQLHKGDGNQGLFIQITADAPRDAEIPDDPGEGASSMTFGVLEMAQALGDRQALLDAGRRVIRFHIAGDVASALAKLTAAVQ